MLSVVAHSRGDESVSQSMVPAVARVMGVVDDEKRVLYFDLIWQSLGPAARRALEELMIPANYEFQSPWGKAYAAAIAEAEAKGRAAGKAEVKAEAREGKAEGRMEGKAESLLVILRTRGLEVSSAIETRIRECRDVAELDRWIERSLSIVSADALFD